MKRIPLIVAAFLCLASGAAATSQQPALLSVYGPGARRLGQNTDTQVIWLSVPAGARDSLYLRLFDADCGGDWDARSGRWNTATSFALYPAPEDTSGGEYAPTDSIPLERLGRPIAQLTVEQDAVYDGKWGTMGTFFARQGRNVGGRSLFVLVVRATGGDDGNRFDVALSRSPLTNTPLESAQVWAYGVSFRLVTAADQSAEARFFVPGGTRMVYVTTADASLAQVWVETPRRSGLSVTALATNRPATTRITVRDAEEGENDWAVSARWPARGSGDVFLRITGDDGQPLSVWLPIGIGRANQRPTASLKMVFLSDCRTVLFDASASRDPDGDELTYEWTFGDGQGGSGIRITHLFGSPGRYTASLTVQDPSGRVNDRAVESQNVVINQAPTAEFTAPQSGSVGEALSFDASASRDVDGQIVSYSWDFGDGTHADRVRTEHQYDRPGRYHVTLQVQDNSSSVCQSASADATVLINAAPVAQVKGPERGSPRQELVFDGSGSVDTDGRLTAFAWEFGDGGSGLGPVVRHAFREPGVYRVRLMVTDDSKTSSAQAKDSISVRINAPPVAIAGEDRRVAVGETTNFDGRRSSDRDGEIVSWKWDFGDGSRAETARVQHAYSAPGTYRVRLTVRDNSETTSDTANATLSVIVNNPPVAIAGQDQMISTSVAAFDGSGSYDSDGRIIAYNWSFGDGDTASTVRTDHAYALPGTYQVVLSITDDSGTRSATTSDTLTLVVNAFPVADMGWSREIVAPGETIELDGSRSVDPDGQITKYEWDFGDGARATGAQVTHQWVHPGRYRVRLSVADNSGSPLATDTEEHVLTVNAPPVAIPGHDRVAAPGEEIIFDASRSYDPDGQNVRYVWDFSDGTPTAQGVRVKHSFAQPGTYAVKVEVSDDAQVANSITRANVIVRVNAPPIARLGEDRHVCETTVTFDGRESRDPDGDRLSFSWDFGDGKQGAGPLVAHTFPGLGEYRVTLTATDDSRTANSSDSTSISVTINGPPVANAGEDRTVCVGEPLIFSGENSRDPEKGPLRYSWNFGDGTIGEGSNPTHTYTRPGVYEVTLTTTDNSNLPCNTDTDVILVRVSAPPVANAGEDKTVCAGMIVQFDGTKSTSASGPIQSYQWDFGDGHIGTGPVTTHVYTVAGTYIVRLTVTADRLGHCDNTDSDDLTITVQEAPKAVFTLPLVLSLDEEVTFDGTASEGRGSRITSYTWDFGDGEQAFGATARHRYPRTGEYVVRLRVITDAGEECRSATWQQTVRVNAPPIAKAGSSRRAALHEVLSFDGSGSRDPDGKIIRYHWDFGDGTEALGISPTYAYQRSGSYRVTLTVQDNTDVSRNTAVDSLVVQVNAPSVPIIERVGIVCLGQAVSFNGLRSTDTDGQIERYLWTFGDGTTGEGGLVTHAYDAPGVYQATLTVTDNSGTVNASASDTVLVRVNLPPFADAGAEQSICPGTIVAFDGTRSYDPDGRIASYVWSFGDQKSDTGASVRHRYDVPGRYMVVLTVRDNSGTACGSASDTTFVVVNAPPVAVADADTSVLVGGAHDAVWFDASRSHDPDGSSLRYQWDFGDGTNAEGVRVRHAYSRPGRYTVTLTVSDNSGTDCAGSTVRFVVNARTR